MRHLMKTNSYLQKGNEAFRQKEFSLAISHYTRAIQSSPELKSVIDFNVSMSKDRMITKSIGEVCSFGIFSQYIYELKEKSVLKDFQNYIEPEKKVLVTKSSPLVSIIMPTWNRAYVIDQAIKSVIDQTYSNWELIICDDASDDGTEEIVMSFCDSRINYEKLDKFNGAVARNHGLRKARGEIYAFLDSDNIWSPVYLEEVVAEHSKDKSAIVYTGFYDCQFQGSQVLSAEKKFREFSYLDLAYRNYIDLNTVSFKAFVYRRLGAFDPSLPRQQDWDLLVRYTAHFTPVGISKPLVLYRRNAEWEQVTLTKKKIDTRKIVLGKNKFLVEEYKKNKIPLKIDISKEKDKKGKKLKTIAIKISAPNEEVAFEWGDYHFAHQLGKALYQYGWKYKVHCQDSWYESGCDVNIVLRGRHRFNVSKSDALVNYLWIISHPDRLASGELDDYDHIFVASEIFVEKVKNVTKTTASILHQATDPSIFKPVDEKMDLPEKVIFIGNSRNEFRTMVKWAVEEKISIALWGSRWEQYVSSDIIQGQYIPNSEVSNYYSSSDILLNDHWETMRKNGFISNRIFDASASGAFLITDNVAGLDVVFEGAVVSVKNKKEYVEALEFYSANQHEREKLSKKARDIVLSKHTFINRAKEIDKRIGLQFI